MNLEMLPVGATHADYKLTSDERLHLRSKALAFYAVPGRYYHDYSHIDAMLDAHWKHFNSDPSDALYLAILMHDAVYVPGHSPASEEISSAILPQMYYRALLKPIPIGLNDRVNELIRWTLPSVHVRDNRQKFRGVCDAAKLLDLDLNQMSNPDWKEFIRVQQRIDREFEHLGAREERCRQSVGFLEQFIRKGFVYYTTNMEHLNKQALNNLAAYSQLVLKYGHTDFNLMLEANPEVMAAEYFATS